MLKRVTLDNFTPLTASLILKTDHGTLYLGNIFNAHQVALYDNPLGIQAVLDVSTEGGYPRNPDVKYLRVPFMDGEEVSEEKFTQCMNFLSRCWDEGLVIQINCAAGVSRSTSIMASFIYYKGLGLTEFDSCLSTLDQILNHIRECRPIIHPHPVILSSCKKHLKIWPFDGSFNQIVV